MAPQVEIEGLCKSFGAYRALTDVSFVAEAGTIHAVVGENGAGKSTLMRVLAGAHRPDRGSVRIGGRAAEWRSTSEARQGGVATVFQELILIPNLSVAENVFLGREPRARFGRVDGHAMREATRKALTRVGLAIDPDRPASSLSVGEQQMVEIARGVSEDASVMIFDEPTAALNAQDSETLFAVLRDLRAEGRTIFYISHRMPEVFALADTITVLKDGRHVLTAGAASLGAGDVVAAMVGRPLEQLYPPRSGVLGQVILDLRAVRTSAGTEPLDLVVRAGEIVSIAGLEGQGQHELLAAIFGVEPVTEGQILLDGHDLTRSGIAGAIGSGLGYAPEDRKTEGLCLQLSIADNIRLGLMVGRSLLGARPGGPDLLADVVGRMGVQARSLNQAVGELSGGNQQKVMLARWLARGVRCLICEEPTRGVDVGAKAEIYRLLRALADQGAAILVASRDLTEVIGLGDRIAVMREGRIVAVLSHRDASETAVMAAATGVST